MKYDELIGKLRGCEGYRCEDCELRREEFCNLVRMEKAADVIEELQNKLNLWRQDKIRRWIPVSERLPNGESDRYLVAYGFMSHLRVAICYYADNLETDNGFYAYDDEHGFHGKTEARYWMPLPEPPKEETDG